MKRNEKLVKKRGYFVNLAIENKSKAALELREIAYSLGYARTKKDIIFALSRIFCVSERTIKRDIEKDKLTKL